MDLQQLHTCILSNVLKNVYIFTGDEHEIMRVYIDKISEVTGCEVCRVDTLLEVHNKVKQKKFLQGKKLYVVFNDIDFQKQEKSWQFFAPENFSKTDLLIMIFPTLDKRTKFFKYYEKIIVDFYTLNDEILIKYVKTQLDGISDKYALKFIHACQNNYSMILSECDKIKCYIDNELKFYDREITANNACKALFKAGQISVAYSDTVNEFTASILKKDITNVKKLLLPNLTASNNTLYILAILYNGFKQMLQVMGLPKDEKNICQKTGLNSWQVNNVKQMIGGYSLDEVVRAVKLIQLVESGIKSGKIESEIALEFVLVNLLYTI